MLISLPIFTVIGFITTGSQAASDALASVNTTTHKIEVRNSRGDLIKTLDAATTWPIKGVVTQEFGNPNPPYQTSHTGIDIDGGYGTPITVFMDGTVIKTGDVLAGCGPHCVIVDHGYGITSIYAHMSSHSVSVGQILHPGDSIGTEGSEGWATGPHLHFEIQILHIPVNPRTFMIGNPSKH
ncbi:MAG TPA: M23 family metallopeptidase [Candidatus Saccharimonadales bacterium]|nr:M23 family metallopeptidase [Candidatus Saccharimonadales bacterium]